MIAGDGTCSVLYGFCFSSAEWSSRAFTWADGATCLLGGNEKVLLSVDILGVGPLAAPDRSFAGAPVLSVDLLGG